MQYIAHKIQDTTITQSLENHLLLVTKLCKDFCIDEFKDIAGLCGTFHDIGKYSNMFQKRIQEDNKLKVTHADCGAVEISKLLNRRQNYFFVHMLKNCIAGHHTGLYDAGSEADTEISVSLQGVLKREHQDYSAYKKEINFNEPDFSEQIKYFQKYCQDATELVELYAFFTKYIFSCLTDADFLDTESFFNPNIKRGLTGNFNRALYLIDQKLDGFVADTLVKQARQSLKSQAIENIKNPADIYFLNMPTGSGKTLCSMKLALERVNQGNKKRIIYVIPYTSIIEQTARTFESIFGDTLPVLEHHSNFDYDKPKKDNSKVEDKQVEFENTEEKLKRTCENWDAPLIVTTSVQFFQSLYHYKGSRLRKLHNLADSIIIFDEIHMMPTDYLQPCLRAIGYVTKHLNSEAIFLSATMPNFDTLFKKYLPLNSTNSLIKDKSYFESFSNCDYEYIGSVQKETLIDKSSKYKSSLIITNIKKNAKDLYDLCEGKKFHLSTYMTPKHRFEVISKIKEAIIDSDNGGESITVISTSLIEAGVDLDFQAVFRELSGLDSIVQSAGRCNREGVRDFAHTFIFELDGSKTSNKGDLANRINITKGCIKKYPQLNSTECIEEYYNTLFNFKDTDIDTNCISKFKNGNYNIENIPFRSYAENFKFIDSDTINIVINNNPECDSLIHKLKDRDYSVKRKLQQYSAQVSFYEFEDMLSSGLLEIVEDVAILKDEHYYNEDTGLIFDAKLDCIF